MVAQWTLIWNSSNSNKESRRDRTKTGDGLTPDDYRARDTARVSQFKVTGKKYADATTISINRVQCFWNRHCIFMGVDSSTHLAACTAENFRVYADWRLKNFKIQKQSTIWVEWKFLRLLFKREIGRKVDEFVGEQISEYILGPLTDEYDLDLSIDCKPVVSVEDLVAILHYHWCLDTASVTHERYTVQNPLIMLMIAYTSSRPGALIESGCLRGSNDALCYKDIVLRVIPNPDQPSRHILVMEVSLLFMKGKRDKSAPTTYIFHERDDNLALCPISHFLALALADGAFEAQGINSVEDVFRIRVQAPRNSLQLKWKQSMLNVPIFRRAMHTTEGVRISPDRALPYDTFNQYLQRLGRNAGFEYKLTPYCIRRGTANAVDDDTARVGRLTSTHVEHGFGLAWDRVKEWIERPGKGPLSGGSASTKKNTNWDPQTEAQKRYRLRPQLWRAYDILANGDCSNTEIACGERNAEFEKNARGKGQGARCFSMDI
ncbi:hypothetical protein ACJ73_01667 [Blastomyces percursus]|uniref:Uncharacterized protein n=1 Tax=Blastomyces percursus TaxID=1658174 RepID=A0A1J9QEP1_9EURO|nr:hypothetical protein ACJ73_01667 [Blastomyces percursus]